MSTQPRTISVRFGEGGREHLVALFGTFHCFVLHRFRSEIEENVDQVKANTASPLKLHLVLGRIRSGVTSCDFLPASAPLLTNGALLLATAGRDSLIKLWTIELTEVIPSNFIPGFEVGSLRT